MSLFCFVNVRDFHDFAEEIKSVRKVGLNSERNFSDAIEIWSSHYDYGSITQERIKDEQGEMIWSL